MKYLLDTNIISELRKGDRCHPGVAAWFASVDDDELFISTLVLGEIRRGIEIVRPRAPERAAELEAWLENIIEGYWRRQRWLTTWSWSHAIRRTLQT